MSQATKRRLLKLFPFIKLAIFVSLLVLIAVLYLRAFLPVYKFLKQNNISPQFIRSLIFDTNSSIKKYKNRTNIIILGISGGTHEGADLTDTIMFISLDWTTMHDTVLISIPRDIWLKSLKAKVNTAYHYGEEKKKGGGLILSKSAIEEIIGVPIHYAWIVDFTGFIKMIDLVGGIKINVDKKIDDKFYPITGREEDFCGGDPTFACRYEHLVFETGWQNMDGEKALKYVRSRYSEGDVGTDFSRSKRQQQVIVAYKNKIIDSSVWKNPDTVKKIFNTFDNATDTDMNMSEQILFMKYFIKVSLQEIRSVILDSGDEQKKIPGFLVNPPLWKYDGNWVLEPKSGTFDEIHKFVSCMLENPHCLVRP